jgi:hypothetical protein
MWSYFLDYAVVVAVKLRGKTVEDGQDTEKYYSSCNPDSLLLFSFCGQTITNMVKKIID